MAEFSRLAFISAHGVLRSLVAACRAVVFCGSSVPNNDYRPLAVAADILFREPAIDLSPDLQFVHILELQRQ
jgi:hypothetical protein